MLMHSLYRTALSHRKRHKQLVSLHCRVSLSWGQQCPSWEEETGLDVISFTRHGLTLQLSSSCALSWRSPCAQTPCSCLSELTRGECQVV